MKRKSIPTFEAKVRSKLDNSPSLPKKRRRKKKKKKKKKEKKEKNLLSHPILHLVQVFCHPARKVARCRHIVPWQVLERHIRRQTRSHLKSYKQHGTKSSTLKYFEDLVSDLFKDSLEELGSYPQDLCSILPLVAWLSFYNLQIIFEETCLSAV